MNIRYFFIAGAITSGLALAIQESDRIVNKQPSPIITPYTVEETNLQDLEPVKGTLDTLNILGTQSKYGTHQRELVTSYMQNEHLLYSVVNLIHAVILFFIKLFFTVNS
ncbi:hypothetical protein [Bartonella florencae]|uniref:hypothetical protein n=1 Tax=Bartonella florencae TaxID=928210 RepID=UPI0005690F1E|nr:hypothetical protein [Bartonella florencae]